MPTKNYDNTVIGQYVRGIENPDSIGWNPDTKRWEQPKAKGFDKRNRGMGVDILNNAKAKQLTDNRTGRWLTEEEERDLRNAHIDYVLGRLDKWTPKILATPPSNAKKAMATGMLYRGDGIKSIINNPALRDAFYGGSDADFQKAVEDFYNDKNSSHYLPERAKLHTKFFDSNKIGSGFFGENLQKQSFADGGWLQGNTPWDKLSIAEQAAMMKAAISEGVYEIKDIKQKYNEFAEGGDVGNQYAEGGILDWIKGLFSLEPKKKYKVIDGSLHNTREDAVRKNSQLVNEGRAYLQKASGTKNVKQKFILRNPNASATAQKSQELENKMFTLIDGNRERTGYRTKNYDIPYGEREIKVRPKGSTIPTTISVNALDSVAKYAGITGTPIQDALGLAMQETGFGRRPYFNYGKLGEGYSSRDLGNANYFKNFGSIPAENLVRDFRYNGDIIYNGKRDEPIPLDTPPLQHALELFNLGKYNPGDPNHTKDVKNTGSNLWQETEGTLQDWWNTEGKSLYNKGAKLRNK